MKPEVFFYQCNVPIRTEEVPVFAKNMTTTTVQRQFRKEESVFARWKRDTKDTLEAAFAEDMLHWKGARLIKDVADRTATVEVLRQHFAILKEIFINESSGGSVYPGISSLGISDLGQRCKLLDDGVSPPFNLSSLDRAYIAASYTQNASDPPNMIRFEFLEALVRIADSRFIATKQIKTYEEATKKLIEEFVLPNFKPVEGWQDWRDKELWTLDINDLLKANLDKLKRIHQSFLTQSHKAMDMKDCHDLCMKDGQENNRDRHDQAH